MAAGLAEMPLRNRSKVARSGGYPKRYRAKEKPQRDRLSSEVMRQLFLDHHGSVWRYLRVLGCPQELAEDLTQETFLAALRRPFVYRGRAAAASYLRRAAYHRYISHLQSIRASNSELNEAQICNATWERWQETQRGDSTILIVLKECFAALPEKSRRALELRFRHGKSRQEIALALSMSEHGAKNLMQRAKKRLRDAMESRIQQNRH